MEIGQIVQGHVNELLGLNESLKDKRMKICLKCPLYKDTLGGICNSNLWLNPKTNEISTEQEMGYYRGCGCRLQAKTTLTTASYKIKKW